MDIHDAFNGRFVVYAHLANGRCFYIGCGSLSRAFDPRREPEWGRVAGSNPVTVRILGRYDTRNEAFEVERALIRQLQPEGNIVGTPRLKRWRCRIRCVETGETFAGSAEAARVLKLSQGAISNVINGRYASVGGYTFVRINPPPLPIVEDLRS